MISGGLALLLGEKTMLFQLFNSNYFTTLDTVVPYVSRVGEFTGIVIIFSLFLFFRNYRNWWFVTAAVSCTLLSSLLTQAIKTAVNAPRPLTFITDTKLIRVLPEWERNYFRSFPSGHTTGAFAMFFLLACLLPERHRRFGILLFIIALMVGYSRMYLAAHFFADIYAGSLVGVGLTAVLLMVLRKYQHRFPS